MLHYIPQPWPQDPALRSQRALVSNASQLTCRTPTISRNYAYELQRPYHNVRFQQILPRCGRQSRSEPVAALSSEAPWTTYGRSESLFFHSMTPEHSTELASDSQVGTSLSLSKPVDR